MTPPTHLPADASRDPRVDPQPGDVFREVSVGIVRDMHVVFAFPDGSLALAVGETYPEHPAWTPDYHVYHWLPERWRRRLASASLVHVAPTPESSR